MQQNETILFVSEAKMITKGSTINNKNNVIKTRITDKKIVVTMYRLYVFESPHTDAASTEFRVKKDKDRPRFENKEKLKKEFYSITGTPLGNSFSDVEIIQIANKDCKIILNENQKFKDNMLRMLPILSRDFSTKNLALLISTASRRIQHFFFPNQDAAIRFARAIKAANAWLGYAQYCFQFKIPINIQWSIFLQDYVSNSETIFVIDPNQYQDGVNQQTQIDSFCVLIDRIQNVAGLMFKFIIKQEYGFQCLRRFVKGIQSIQFMRKIDFSGCDLTDESMLVLSGLGQNFRTLTTLNLSKNKLTDHSMIGVKQLFISCNYIKNVNLSHNNIAFADADNFTTMIKATKQHLILDFSYNNVNDQSISIIENTIIFSTDIPLKQIDFSYNKFTRYGQWRIYVGSMRNLPHIKFILYPLHFHSQVFKIKQKWHPRLNDDTISSFSSQTPKSNNTNIREGIMSKISPKHADKKSQITIEAQPTIGIKIARNAQSNKAPAKTQDLQKIQKIKTKLSLMIGSKNASLQTIHDVAKQISSYDFSFPTIALQDISQDLWAKMEVALRHRDHEAIQLIAQSCSLIGININGYKDRLLKVDQRKDLFCKRLYNLFNFQMDQMELVPELQELIKQSLRLCLKGTAIDLLYYLKFLKDQKIKTFIKTQYSPYVELQGRRTQSYAKLFQKASQNKQQTPLIKSVDLNLYDYYLYVNYFLLAITSREDYELTITVLKSALSFDSSLSKYIYLALQRINFIMTEFYKSFIYSAFSISYLQLKINSCRMVWQYQNIKKSVLYSDLPNFPKKTAITPQKFIKVPEDMKQVYANTYSFDNYDNIKTEARQYGIHLYKAVFTRYFGKLFNQQVKKLCQSILKFFQALCTSFQTLQQTARTLLQLIQFVRTCTHVNELLEQLYVHIICFKGSQKQMDFLNKIIPILTMYLRPPQVIEGYLISHLIRQQFNFQFSPLSIVFNKTSTSKYVDRDWIPTQKQMVQLISLCGKVMVPISTTQRKIKFIISIQQSKTVGDLMNVVYQHNVISQYVDKATFWIYKHNLQTSSEQIILFDDYIGQLMSSYDENKQQLIIRRRVYSPYYMINYQRYTDSVLNSIFHEVKHFYLLGVAYTVFDDSQNDLAMMILIVDVLEQSVQNSRQIDFSEDNLNLFTQNIRQKISQLIPITTRNTRTFKIQTVVNQIKAKVQLQLKQSSTITIQKYQRTFLDEFRNHHYYCASNYQAKLFEQNEKCLVSINSQFICVETITDQKNIFYESLLSLCPQQKFLNIYYYDKQKLETVELVLETKTRVSIAIVMDVVSYSVLRLYTSSVFIYLQRELHEMMFKYDYPISAFDPEKQERGQEYIISILKHRRGQSQSSIKQIVGNINHIVGRLRTMDLLAFKQTDFIFQQQIKFSKWQLDRQVFPSKSERILTKSQKIVKGQQKFNQESNWDESIGTKQKKGQDDESVTPKGQLDQIAEMKQDSSPLLKTKPKNNNKNVIYNKDQDSEEGGEVNNLDKAFDLQPVVNELNFEIKQEQKNNIKIEPPKLEIPKLQLPKRALTIKTSEKQPQNVSQPPLIGRQLPKIQQVSQSPMKQSKAITEIKIETQKFIDPPKTQVLPQVFVSQPVIPPEPVAQIQEPPKTNIIIPPPPTVIPPPILPPQVPYIPPVTTHIPVPIVPPPQQPKPSQDQQVVTVIKPRNSNPAYGRASRRRAG